MIINMEQYYRCGREMEVWICTELSEAEGFLISWCQSCGVCFRRTGQYDSSLASEAEFRKIISMSV